MAPDWRDWENPFLSESATTTTLEELNLGFLADPNKRQTLKEFLKNPRVTVVGLLASWIVTNVIIRPAGWMIALAEWAAENTFLSIAFGLKISFGTTGTAVYNAFIGTPTDPGAFYLLVNQLAALIPLAGLAAPIATAIVFSVVVALFVGALVLIGKIIVDAIPGGGAFLS